MSDPRFRLLAELSREDGAAVATCPIVPDWYPAEESLRFRALRLDPNLDGNVPARITPVWDVDGPPYVRVMEAVLTVDGGEPLRGQMPITYFRAQVHAAAAKLLGDQYPQDGSLNYRIVAFPLPEEGAKPPAARSWSIQEVFTSPVCGERSLSHYLESSEAFGEAEADLTDAGGADDFPVFIPDGVLRQAEALKCAAGEDETGSILIGYLWKDAGAPEVFAEVTALVPAQHTVANSTRLTFSHQTWDAVHAAIALRGRQEVFLGWHHTHPARFWCKCEPEAQKQCPLGRQFFSTDDVALHRTVFSKAFHVALVTGDSPLAAGGWEMVHSLWGWRNGMVQSRGFRIVPNDALANGPLAPSARTPIAIGS